MKRILLALTVTVAIACSDDEVTVPTPEAPVSDITLTQFGADSLRVTFAVTQSYGVAVLRVHTGTSDLYSRIDSIPGTSAREFRTRWRNWVLPTDTFGWVGVEVGYGTNNSQRYARFEQFTPAP